MVNFDKFKKDPEDTTYYDKRNGKVMSKNALRFLLIQTCPYNGNILLAGHVLQDRKDFLKNFKVVKP